MPRAGNDGLVTVHNGLESVLVLRSICDHYGVIRSGFRDRRGNGKLDSLKIFQQLVVVRAAQDGAVHLYLLNTVHLYRQLVILNTGLRVVPHGLFGTEPVLRLVHVTAPRSGRGVDHDDRGIRLIRHVHGTEGNPLRRFRFVADFDEATSVLEKQSVPIPEERPPLNQS